MVHRRNETGCALCIRSSMVIFDETLEEVPLFIQWSADHGLDQALFFTDYLGTIHHEPAQVQKIIGEAYAAADRNPQMKVLLLEDFDWSFASRHGLTPVRTRPIFEKEAKPCPVAFDTLFVNPDGAAKPCCKSWYLFGNLVRNSLAEVWNSPSAVRFRERQVRLDFRDCLVVCDLNPKPINRHVADIRKACWVIRRDPKAAVAKGLRKLGLTSSQKRQPQAKA
jgi:MoaA/NifB/PqqE/SkfB family radical SAM enzyme